MEFLLEVLLQDVRDAKNGCSNSLLDLFYVNSTFVFIVSDQQFTAESFDCDESSIEFEIRQR